jgi:mono/diheme cytochrome c family protein
LDITNNAVSTLYTPAKPQFLGYPNLHWNGDRLLFTGLTTNGARPYTVFEMKTDGTGLKQMSPNAGSDVDWFDPCYLPCGDLLMASTATFAGVPCVTGGDYVGNLYRVSTNGLSVRQLTFDQDQNWGPTILSDGRVMYTRWEYSDTAHYFTRILFTMMPDGLEQFARYGSGSYFPNTIFDAKPIPGKPSKFVAIVSGHHGVAREGEMILFDEAVSTFEADGVLHRYCGPNPVLPEIRDQYIDQRNPWPRFVQPCPLDEKQLVVSARTSESGKFGLYLVDEFDNITTLYADSGSALMHATPLRAMPTPPVIPDRVKPGTTNGIVNVSDLYFGPGLKDVPRGKIKNLRVYSVHYGYRNQGGHINIGVDGPWDVHRILGTVPVYEDGSASFYAPANTPISVQPLDEEGKALQLFRSWYTVMPGESVSCAGCHEKRNVGMVNQSSLASRKEPDSITPWFGPERGFSFLREVQPVLDQYCVGCHGGTGGTTNVAPDLYTTTRVAPATTSYTFPNSYLKLHPYVRRTGNEGSLRMNNAGEWHADTSELIQILKKGHYGVTLSSDAWSRLVTWIDLNVPAWGTWTEHQTIGGTPDYHDRRKQTMASYANLTLDPEVYPTPAPARGTFVAPATPTPFTPVAPPADTLFDVYGAKARRSAITNSTTPAELTLNLGNGVSLTLDLIPAGRVLMGSASGYRDEAPQAVVTNSQPFYMAKFEIMNKQYALFDPRSYQRVRPHYWKGSLLAGLELYGDKPAGSPRFLE